MHHVLMHRVLMHHLLVLGGGSVVVGQLVEVVAGGALDIVAVVDHLTVAVEAFVKGKVLQPRFCRRFYRRHAGSSKTE
jgi:hypothetical protein